MQLITPAGRAEWLALRHQYISSTESAALFGSSPYMTAYELALEKTSEKPIEIESSERMRWGIYLQDAIAVAVGLEFGVEVQPLRAYAVHENGLMGSSFDYEIIGITEKPGPEFQGDYALRTLFLTYGPGVLEIKNVDSFIYKKDWVTETSGEGEEATEMEVAPDHIEIQVQHQLECIRYGWACIAALVGGNRPKILVRLRDEMVGKMLRQKVEQFMGDLHAGILPPVVMPEDADIIIKLHQFADPGKVLDAQGRADIAALCVEYRKQALIAKAAEEAKKSARAQLLMLIGSAERVILEGFSISAGMVGPCEVAYTREGYRNFRVTEKKTGGKDKAKP